MLPCSLLIGRIITLGSIATSFCLVPTTCFPQGTSHSPVARGRTRTPYDLSVSQRMPRSGAGAQWCTHCNGIEYGMGNNGGSSGIVGDVRVFRRVRPGANLLMFRINYYDFALIYEYCRSCNMVGWLVPVPGTVPPVSSWPGRYYTTIWYPLSASDPVLASVRAEGAAHNCHSCGNGLYSSPTAGYTQSTWIVDHIPPGSTRVLERGIGSIAATLPMPTIFSLAPHCWYCSNTQSAHAGVWTRRWRTVSSSVKNVRTFPGVSDPCPLVRHAAWFRRMRLSLLRSDKRWSDLSPR